MIQTKTMELEVRSGIKAIPNEETDFDVEFSFRLISRYDEKIEDLSTEELADELISHVKTILTAHRALTESKRYSHFIQRLSSKVAAGGLD